MIPVTNMQSLTNIPVNSFISATIPDAKPTQTDSQRWQLRDDTVMLSDLKFDDSICSVDALPSAPAWLTSTIQGKTDLTYMQSQGGTIPAPNTGGWAFVETFDGDPTSPSQARLPRSFDYVVTHRTHPADHLREFSPYLADHDDTCAGPNPNVSPLPQHLVVTDHRTNGDNPDKSFFVCKNHMMSSMGNVEGYSVTAFWPKQAFDFANGGTLEFDVNLNDNHPRSWWEVLIVPRNQLRVGAAQEWLPIDETYPNDHFLFNFSDNIRNIQVGTSGIEAASVVVAESDWTDWAGHHPTDPANADRRIRRTMQIRFDENQITWSIEMENGDFDTFTVAVPNGLPFTRGLVLFKTHAYTPSKEENLNSYTFHWDNIRFSGPVVGRYEDYEASDIVYMQANGSRSIGETATVTIDLPKLESNPVLFGQVHNAMRGQVLLRINNGDPLVVHPSEYTTNNCSSSGWKSFYLPLDPTWLQIGENVLTWEIGPRPACADDWLWDGFSIKNLEIQLDVVLNHKLFLPLLER